MDDNQKQDEQKSGTLHFDYKNAELLKKYVNPHARMYNRRRTGLTASQQRSLATAVKRARFMAIMPYISH